MNKTANISKYRLVTPGMDVTVGYESRVAALEEAGKRAAHHPVKLYVSNLSGGWTMLFNTEMGGEI